MNFPWKTLLDWYKKHGRHNLPWRQYQNFDTKHIGYSVWLSEIMLQQTQASRVVDYFNRCVGDFPTAKDLSKLTWEEFFEYYKGLGYYNRGKNMLLAVQTVTKNFDGAFPSNPEELVQLPWVWPYTAQAICAFAYNQPLLSFDTNLQKIFSRFLYGSKNQKLTKQDLEDIQGEFLSTGISGRDINNALMDFGAMISLNSKQNIDWDAYPLKNCKFYLARGADELQKKKSATRFKKEIVDIEVHLHKDHKEYYSANLDEYSPFMLPPHSKDHRHYIQDYFKTQHNLDVSVRPAYKKEQDRFYYHAQIQKGNHVFGVFSSKEG